jgi:catechol 2,3-dioxygenase-like lactoylglutathione lyase family enzyme
MPTKASLRQFESAQHRADIALKYRLGWRRLTSTVRADTICAGSIVMHHLFGKSVHSAFVVPDLDESVARMLASGFGPAFELKQLKFDARFHGERHVLRMNVAFFAVGATHFEFIEQLDDGPSTYREFLERNPAGGLHHVAYCSRDFNADLARARAAGIALEVVEELLAPDGSLFEVYCGPKDNSNAVLIQLMYPISIGAFDQMEAIAAAWDGSKPHRNLLDLLPKEISLSTD